MMLDPTVADCRFYKPWMQSSNKQALDTCAILYEFRSKKHQSTVVYCTELLYFFPFLSVVLTGDEEPDSASRAHLEKGWQRSSGICFLPPAALEEGRGSLKPTTLHLGGQYVSLLLLTAYSTVLHRKSYHFLFISFRFWKSFFLLICWKWIHLSLRMFRSYNYSVL